MTLLFVNGGASITLMEKKPVNLISLKCICITCMKPQNNHIKYLIKKVIRKGFPVINIQYPVRAPDFPLNFIR